MLRCGGLKVHLVVISGMNPRETINASGLFRKRIVFVRFDLSQPLLEIVIGSIDEYFASGTFVGFDF